MLRYIYLKLQNSFNRQLFRAFSFIRLSEKCFEVIWFKAAESIRPRAVTISQQPKIQKSYIKRVKNHIILRKMSFPLIDWKWSKSMNLYMKIQTSFVGEIERLFFNLKLTELCRAWRWHVTVGGDSHREILIFCHRHRHRHRRRKKYSPSPSPPGKKNFTVTVTAEQKNIHRHRHRRSIFFSP